MFRGWHDPPLNKKRLKRPLAIFLLHGFFWILARVILRIILSMLVERKVNRFGRGSDGNSKCGNLMLGADTFVLTQTRYGGREVLGGHK